jgi:hypothetical protein
MAGLYDRFWRPECFPLWASGLSEASLERTGEVWRAKGPDGPITIRFTAHNAFGIMDHWVDVGGGCEVYVPLRVVANGTGCLVSLTLFRLPEMHEFRFARDVAWVERDLEALKRLAEVESP